MKPSVSYATFCCQKDITRVLDIAEKSVASHAYDFDEKWFVFQRCTGMLTAPPGFEVIRILAEDYPAILQRFGIQYPNETLSELTHGWSAPHFWAHHVVNHVAVLMRSKADYIVFSDGDCFIKEQPEGKSWVDEGIRILESNAEVFVVSPSDGRPDGGLDRIMSQQMFIVNRKKFLEMEFLPWDGKFMDGGPAQEYYGMLEGIIDRFMRKHNLFRYVLPIQWRYWHAAFH